MFTSVRSSKSLEYDTGSLSHTGAHGRHILGNPIGGSADQHGVMDDGANLQALLGREAAREP